MTEAAAIAEHCEAKLHAFRKTQDGIVIAFTIHPNEIPKGVALADLGTRYMLAMAEIGENELPVMADASTSDDEGYSMAHGQPELSNKKTSAAKPKREMTLASRVAIICKDKMFQSFCFQQLDYEPIGFCPVDTETRNEESTSNYVRKRCKVKSRSEIKYDTPEAADWKSLYEEFQGSEYAA